MNIISNLGMQCHLSYKMGQKMYSKIKPKFLKIPTSEYAP